MALKSLKATITVQAPSLEDAIVFLSQRFLRPTKTGCRVVQTPTDICAADVCQPLIDGWMSGRVAYSKGKIALVFRSGELAQDADMLIYTPKDGDRFLYTKPQPALKTTSPAASRLPEQLDASATPAAGTSAEPSQGLRSPTISNRVIPSPGPTPSASSNLPTSVVTALQTLPGLINHLQSLEAKVETLLITPAPARLGAAEAMNTVDSSPSSTSEDSSSLSGSPQAFASILTHHVKQQLSETIAQQTLHTINRALEPVLQQLDDLQDQIETLTDYVAELDIADFSASPPVPQTDDEWIERINANWGTVGDYEKYSQSYRDANAEAPLQETPDWVALCEFDWVWPLCPTLQSLYQLIRGTGGIGDDGADILQQFGQHIDPKTGDPYYLYQLGGYSALEALRQLAYNSDHSWQGTPSEDLRCGFGLGVGTPGGTASTLLNLGGEYPLVGK